MALLTRKTASALASASLLGLAAAPASAFNFHLADGEILGAFDTDITWGMSARTENAHTENLGNSYGNRLYRDAGDIFTHTLKMSNTLELKGHNWGTLIRGNMSYDFKADKRKLNSAAENRLVHHGDITDAYAYVRLGADQNWTVRAGKQVISWGENTFIGGAINDINTVDITKLRQPGVELKDAFVGTPALNVAWNLSDDVTLEAFTLFSFDEIKVDPVGGFFAGLDAIGDGGGFINGTIGGTPRCVTPDGEGSCDLFGGLLTRTGDDIPSGGGQWGLALKVFKPTWGSGMEFGFYYQNLHDHLPMISAIAGAPGSARFIVEYPENIERWGASFNTMWMGTAFGGEISHRKNAPVQLVGPLAAAAFGGAPAGTFLKGYEDISRTQMQLTVQKIWGVWHAIGADVSTTIGEIAVGKLGGLPDSTALFEPDITDSYWGFQVRHNLSFTGAIAGIINVDPNIAYRWDVNGVSNELGGAKLMVEGRQSLTTGLNFSYLVKYTAGISYTRFWGGEGDHLVNAAGSRLNGGTDRDFVAVNLKYSF
jgi:hypothetical protein